MTLEKIKLNHLKSSFSPIADEDIEILILGTMPSDASLAKKEYYGHPRNRFWKLIAEITKTHLPQTYEDKKALLLKHRIGIWDIAQKAERKGSLDSAIKEVIPNDIDFFLKTHPLIHTICFNGVFAQKLHDQYFIQKKEILYLLLPSSSPANAAISAEELSASWQRMIN